MSINPKLVIILSEDEALRNRLTSSLISLGTQAYAVANVTELTSLISADNQADCIVLDQKLSDNIAVETNAALREREIATPLVLVSREEALNQVVAAARIGVSAVITPQFTAQDLQIALKQSQDSRALAEHEVHVHQLHRRIDSMTDRERRVLNLASRGLPNKTIATRIGVSMKTVERDRRIAYCKLGVRSTAEMARELTMVECHELAVTGAKKELAEEPEMILTDESKSISTNPALV